VRLEVAFVSDREIGRLNRAWLGHRGATDVISFPMSERARGTDPLLGALAVSVETARREAASRGHATYHELLLYVVHGVLHLVGHDDGTARERARMRRAEATALRVLGLPAVYDRAARAAKEAS
jgi:probable rRNA maturation factor